MPRRSSAGAKQLPDHIKASEIVLVKYHKSWWPSLIKNVYPGKVTYVFLPIGPKPQTFNTNTPLKSILPFDDKVPQGAPDDLQEAYEAAFDILSGNAPKTVPKPAAAGSVDEQTTSKASPVESTPSDGDTAKMLASAVMKGAPKLKFVKDEVIMTPKHDKNGAFYQWPALIRKVDKDVAVFTFFPIKTKEILMSDRRHNILPFPAKHVGKMIDEASEVSPDLAEALRDTASYLDMSAGNAGNVPPSPKKTDNKPTNVEASKPKKGEKSKPVKTAAKAASPDSLDREIEEQLKAMPDARNKGKEQPAKQATKEAAKPVTKEPAKQITKEPAKATSKSPPKPKRGGKKRQHEEEEPQDNGDSKRLKEVLLEEDPVGEDDVQPLDADARAALLTYITSDQAHVWVQDIWYGTRTSLRHERFMYPETYGSYTSLDFDHGGYLEQWDQLDKAIKQCWEWMELNKEDAEGKVELDIFRTPGRRMSYVARVIIPEMVIAGLKQAHKVNFEIAEKIFNKTSKLNPQPFDDEENGEGFWEDRDPHNGGDSNGTEGSSGLMELARVAKGQIGNSSDEQ